MKDAPESPGSRRAVLVLAAIGALAVPIAILLAAATETDLGCGHRGSVLELLAARVGIGHAGHRKVREALERWRRRRTFEDLELIVSHLQDSPVSHAQLERLLGNPDASRRSVAENGAEDFFLHYFLEDLKRPVRISFDPVGERVIGWFGWHEHCVARGTLICAERGEVPIEELRPGERVWSLDPSTKRRTLNRVIEVSASSAAKTLLIAGELRVTAEHPILASGAWKRAADLAEGDVLIGSSPASLRAGRIQRIVERVEVFDLELEDAPHSYFAGGILVHNKSK
jgi:hypothetical protein